ncbi:hypothetical protein AWB78_07175 [Caballeronia calidae]|uniref:Uncharacterized protein n=1 Tax=Caballeronia calidae TaxID=1777139 RepID=A0A158EDB0_9BURK|nr:hypothetical protein [Caballeronia calidae]SAL04882.1 hypothetical protein AWB78_07175 [Caballeronia calidae]
MRNQLPNAHETASTSARSPCFPGPEGDRHRVAHQRVHDERRPRRNPQSLHGAPQRQENALDVQGAYRTSHAPKYYRGQFGSGGRQCNPAVARKVLEITLSLLVRPNTEPRDKHA